MSADFPTDIPPELPTDSLADFSPDLPANPTAALQVDPRNPDFQGYVVGIGASAGGLEALEKLFGGLPGEPGAAFVVVQHLSPDHKSMMDSLLGRHTAMPVVNARDAMPLEKDHVYLIPPGSLLTVAAGRLRLSPKNPGALSLPVDLFFTSLARDRGARAIGVVLSGTGSDGTRGAVAINDAGGLLLAQSLESAKFDGMPRSVIATGLVDDVLPPEALGQRILEHIRGEPRAIPPREIPSLTEGSTLEQLLHVLRRVGKVDFRDYKPATVWRRIERRMQVRHAPTLEDYLQLLEGDRLEVAALRREILIPVTSFFRDPDSFETLAQGAIQSLVRERPEAETIRIWVAGTSTGEEAYTVAILFAEACEQAHRWPTIRIFATDVEQQSIDTGSAGIYSEAIANEVSAGRLERFFTRRGAHYVVQPDIRQNIVFARHNLLEDPPFTRMDLVTCRNVLIYFQPVAQERALRRLQYALGPGGYLFLGSSESLGALHKDFAPVSSRHKIYKVLRHLPLPLDAPERLMTHLVPEARPLPRGVRPGGRSPDSGAVEVAHAQLLRNYVPATLLITGARELVHVFGDAHRFLRIGEGIASLDVSRLLPERLVPVAAALIHKASKDRVALSSEPTIVALSGGRSEQVRVVVRPLAPEQGGDGYLLLSLEAEAVADRAGSDDTPGVMGEQAAAVEQVRNLERELIATRESLQATIEELGTANEELQATNEELMASNEELQSSNEELQSLNEELYTVNAENQEKIEILHRLNADLEGITRAAGIPTVFVDQDLRLTRFTREVGQIFKIREGDVGRSLDDFAHTLEYPELVSDLRRTLQTGNPVEREVRSGASQWYLVRILPYGVPHTQVRGAVVTCVDVTTLKDMQRLQGILDSLPEHVAVVQRDGRITLVNRAWRAFAMANGDPGLAHSGPGSNYLEACAGDCDEGGYAGRAAAGLQGVLTGELSHFSLEYPCHSPTEQRWFLMHVAPVPGEDGGAVISHVNITEWVLGRSKRPEA